jgi:hypothetical protein
MLFLEKTASIWSFLKERNKSSTTPLTFSEASIKFTSIFILQKITNQQFTFVGKTFPLQN